MGLSQGRQACLSCPTRDDVQDWKGPGCRGPVLSVRLWSELGLESACRGSGSATCLAGRQAQTPGCLGALVDGVTSTAPPGLRVAVGSLLELDALWRRVVGLRKRLFAPSAVISPLCGAPEDPDVLKYFIFVKDPAKNGKRWFNTLRW